jgi:hypothetical protein
MRRLGICVSASAAAEEEEDEYAEVNGALFSGSASKPPSSSPS